MRQAPQEMGRVQRQVTARPTAGLQAPQQQILIDPNSNRFADALVDFANTAGKAYKQHVDTQRDAQAVAADVALDGYNQAMNDVLRTRPDIFDRPEEFEKIDREMRDKYFKDISDEEILGKVTSRLDTWVDTKRTSYTYAKQEKQRLDLSTTYFMNSVKKVEELHKAGQLDEEQASNELRTLMTTLGESPSFQLSQEQRESLITSLQDAFSKDGSHRVLLARTFMNDESLSPEVRMSLEADLAEGLAMTAAEKTEAQFKLYQQLEPQIERGQLRWAALEPYVQQGIISADDARSMMRRQQSKLEARIKEAQERNAAFSKPAYMLTGPEFKKVEEELRNRYYYAGPEGRQIYYTAMRQYGGTNPVLKAQAERAFSLTSTTVQSNEEIPQGFQVFMNEARDVWSMGLLSQHIPPEKLADTHAFLYMTQRLGTEPYEAYNLLVQQPSAKYSDIDRNNLRDLEEAIRKEIGLQEGMVSEVPSTAANIGMKMRKALGLSQNETLEELKKMFKGSHIETSYGPVPLAYVNVGEEVLKQRLDIAAKEVAAEMGTDPDDLVVHLSPTGQFNFTLKGGDAISAISAKPFDFILSNDETLPDGTQTAEGRRKEALIDDITKPEYDPFGDATLYDTWRNR